MEQRRRTIQSGKSQKRRNNSKKTLTIIGVILGLALVFFVSYKIAYGLISTGENKEKPETAISSSTEEDIANMSREDLEESYVKLKKQLEEKEEEIEMLKERLEGDTPSETVKPSETTESRDDEPEENDEPQSTPKPTAPPAATPKPTQAPMQEEPPAATEAPDGGLMSPEDLANLTGSTH